MSDPSVTVIVPSVRNHEELDIVLKGLKNQSYDGQIETVVVGPTNDPGTDICLENNIRFIDDEGSRTRADACNIAIASTNSELIFFTDDDVIVPKNWVEKLVSWFRNCLLYTS